MGVGHKLRRLFARRWVRWPVAIGLVHFAVGCVVLESLRRISVRRGVQSVALPVGSEVAARAAGANYVDAYRATLPQPVALGEIERFAFQRGTTLISTPHEIVYESGAPGLRFLVSYHLTDPGPEQSVTVSTVVFYESLLGAIYFSPVKEVHRRGVPFIVSQLVHGDR